MPVSDFRFGDLQVGIYPPAAYRGMVPDPMFPGREWMEGELRRRPVCGPPGSFYVGDDGRVWLWLCPVWQLGLLTNRPRRVRPGTTWKATDTNQIFVWME